jgi:hypothetical protein
MQIRHGEYSCRRWRIIPRGDQEHGYMWKIEKTFSVRLGGNKFINVPDLIVYKGDSLFQLRRGDDGTLGIDFKVHDANHNRIATFVKGIVVEGDAEKYDVKSGHMEYVVTEKASGNTVARVQRRGVEGAELDVWIKTFLPNGVLLDATPDSLKIGNVVQISGSTMKNCRVGIALG